MIKRWGLSIAVLFFFSLSLVAQRVIRKGTTPIDVTKNKNVPAKYSLAQLQGRWQEIKRLTGKQTVSFTDSLQLKFEKNKVEIREGMNLNQNGEAQVDAPAMLQAAGDSYEIISLNESLLLINDGEFTRQLQKLPVFYYETVGKIFMPEEKLDTPVNIALSSLKGRWMVYRRLAQPSFINDSLHLIKTIQVNSINPDGNTGKGLVVFYKTDITETAPCTINCTNGIFEITTAHRKWTFYTYKADDKFFVFGKSGELQYFAKRL